MLDPSWRPTLPPVDAETLPGLLAEHRVVVLHCWAAWNGYDRQMDAVLRGLVPLFAGQVVFYSLNTDLEAGWPLLRVWGVLNLPALVCLIDGDRHETLIGLKTEVALEVKVREWLSAAP
jgi:thiol-disulfide isomerase/thioredoxin